MGIIILFVFIIILVGYLSYIGTDKDIHKRDNAIFGAIVATVVLTLITIITIAVSYNTVVEIRQKLATIEQYQETVNVYADKGVAEFRPGSGSRSELTDLKYNHYQQQIGQMITDLRNSITNYNRQLVGKKVMDGNWLFSWVILCPDDLKTIKMGDYPLK